jgi:tetratricopeptide (TPR) repeat protein
VLFTDLKDSMTLIRDLDPEAAQQLLDPALHVMMDAVHRYGGTVNQVLGDGIMALFGAPLAHEDHAVRACYAALAMQVALRDYAEAVRRTHGLTMQSRIGLNSGEVVVRTIHRDLHMDYSAVGQTGVGKSRLVDEFVQAVHTQGWLVLDSAAVSYSQATPYFPILDLLRRYYHLEEHDDARTIQAKVTEQVQTLDVALHDTIPALLAARIDRLPSEEKRLLQIAAVIGTEVPLPLLQTVGELPVEALRLSLAHLRDAEFLYEASLFPELVYTFKHALPQEVAYGSLLQEQRRPLHARIVEAIEMLYADRVVEQVERLAYHAMSGAGWDKALPYCRQAGAKAFARAALREAAAAFEQALAALGHLPESRDTREQEIDLRLALRTMLATLGEHERIFVHLQQAETLAEALGDQRRLGQVLALMGWYFWVRGDYDYAMASCQRALALAETLGEDALGVISQYVLGNTYHALGDFHRAIDFQKKNLVCLTGELLYAYFSTGTPLAISSRTHIR